MLVWYINQQAIRFSVGRLAGLYLHMVIPRLHLELRAAQDLL